MADIVYHLPSFGQNVKQTREWRCGRDKRVRAVRKIHTARERERILLLAVNTRQCVCVCVCLIISISIHMHASCSYADRFIWPEPNEFRLFACNLLLAFDHKQGEHDKGFNSFDRTVLGIESIYMRNVAAHATWCDMFENVEQKWHGRQCKSQPFAQLKAFANNAARLFWWDCSTDGTHMHETAKKIK